MTKIVLFPGQGSQKKGMGRDLFSAFPLLMGRIDRALGYSVEKLCLDDPDGKLAKTQFTQVAMYVVNALSYFNWLRNGDYPDVVAGHSLGEYNALLAAEVFDFMTGLALVKRRGELMAEAEGGGMAAVIGLTDDQVERTLASTGTTSVTIANYNSREQVVIAGPEQDVKAMRAALQGAGARFVPLRVSGAFHSPYMEQARRRFEAFVEPLEFRAPARAVMSNVTGTLHDPSSIKRVLVEQIVRPVRWTSIVQELLRRPNAEFQEVGPGTVLKGLVDQQRAAA